MQNIEDNMAKIKAADRLLGKHQIRGELKKKFYYCYPKLFEGLFNLLSLSELDDLFFYLSMHFAERMMQFASGDKDGIKINWRMDSDVSYSLLFQEVFDDYWAAFVCFQHGFTKQCIEILRNTLELSLIIYFSKFCDGGNNETIARWSAGEKIASMSSMIDKIKKTEFSKAENIAPYLVQIYSRLCMATHSHKIMTTSLTVPGGFRIKEKMMFEPFIVPQTRSLFLLVLEIELKIMRQFFTQDMETDYLQKILSSISKIEECLKQYSEVIESIKKGYVLHRKQIVLNSGKAVLFSLKLDNVWELKGKHVKSLNADENKELNRAIENLLLNDPT